MKRIIATILAVCLLVACIPALASTDARVVEDRIATRSGPGTRYTEPGSFLYYGADVTVHTKVWDSRNELYWLQIEFVTGREKYRAYTGDWRLDVDLDYVPYEIVEGYSWTVDNVCGYAGPGYDYHYYSDIVLYRYSDCTIIEVENDFALVEAANSSQGLTRVWVPLNVLAHGSSFYGHDTFTGHYPTMNDGPTLLPEDDGPVLLPGGSNGYYGYVDPVGQYVTVWVDSGHARSGPGTDYAFLNYVNQGDVLQVLDYQMGNTGKDWYQVRINGRLCWLSSGLVTLNGNSEGTAYGVPIIPTDPFADYRQTDTHLIGRWIRINASSAHVRQEPHTDTPTVGYVKQNQYYEILDCRIGNTGKVWYKIWVEGEYGWISSGLVTLLEN